MAGGEGLLDAVELDLDVVALTRNKRFRVGVAVAVTGGSTRKPRTEKGDGAR